jgi:hypothetical protein
MADYSSALPNSFKESAFVGATPLKNFDFGATIPSQFTGETGIDSAGQFNSVADALSGTGALSTGGGWTFITAPEDVSWDVANQATRVDIFGTNNPPVVAGSRGMRDLTLSNSLVEGFQRNKSVEAKVASLEALMNYGLNTSDGFVSVPVYQVWANSKSYGGPEAYYIIKDIKVKETMRDIQGQSTRAYVDISLMQVPAYQVNSGRDQAREVTTGAGTILAEYNKNVEELLKKQGATGAVAQGAAIAQQNGQTPAAATPAGRSGPRGPAPGPTNPAAPTYNSSALPSAGQSYRPRPSGS